MTSTSAASRRSSDRKQLDQALTVLKDRAGCFATLPIAGKRALIRESMNRILDVADAWVADGNGAKGIALDSGEEWLTGPVPTMRNLRLLDHTLARIERGQATIRDEQIRQRSDGRMEVAVFPTDALDRLLLPGVTIAQRMEPAMDARAIKDRAGAWYRERTPTGGVALILGAGNVSSIAPTDALHKSFAHGSVCIVKMNPVNEWAGPHLEYVFKPFIDAGYMRIVYGGGDVGSYLVDHEHVDAVHITGSSHTHDLIVWGPPGAERDRRMRAGTPLLDKRITSELGNVSPVAIVPARYSTRELAFMAKNIAAMVTNNASFNCNAAKVLITAACWTQRDDFLSRLERVLRDTPTRMAYYPGAFDRYERLVGGRDNVKTLGQRRACTLPWTILYDVDPFDKEEPVFSIEPFCAILSETRLTASEPATFVQHAADFMNNTLYGTLNATYMVPPAWAQSGEVGQALDRAIDDLRYGTVTINQWAALGFAAMSPVWGGHPCGTLHDAQSGVGWVHNTYLLDGVEKSVLRGPLTMFPKPAWFADNKKAAVIGAKLLRLEHCRSLSKLPGIALSALQG